MSNLTIQQINSGIMFGTFTNEQLDSIISAVKYARSQLVKTKVRSFRNGDSVKFVHPRTGRLHIGTVKNVKIKFITVTEGLTNWNVPANLLEPA